MTRIITPATFLSASILAGCTVTAAATKVDGASAGRDRTARMAVSFFDRLRTAGPVFLALK